jgi:DNA-binding phage protein
VAPAPTRLEAFISSRKIKPALLAKESGYSRQQLYRVRIGSSQPTAQRMARIVAACRRISHENVCAEDLFDMGSE